MDDSHIFHATCVAIHGVGVLIEGPSGSGKSDLALRLIDRGAALVSDDYTVLTATPKGLIATPPATISGRIEVRGIGIVEMAHVDQTRVALLVSLGKAERLPEARRRTLAGIAIREIILAPLEASAPIKVEIALAGIAE